MPSHEELRAATRANLLKGAEDAIADLAMRTENLSFSSTTTHASASGSGDRKAAALPNLEFRGKEKRWFHVAASEAAVVDPEAERAIEALRRQLRHHQRMWVEAGMPLTAQSMDYSGLPQRDRTGGATSANPKAADFINNLATVLGPPGVRGISEPIANKSLTVPNLNDYFPKAEILQEIIMYDRVTSSELAIFEVFKFEYTESMEFELNVMVFNSHIADRITYRTAPRLVSHQAERRHFRLVMIGMGQGMEAMLYGTVRGKQIFAYQQIQVERAIEELWAVGCFLEILYAPNSYSMSARNRRPPRLVDISQLILEEVKITGTMSRDANPVAVILEHLMSQISHNYAAAERERGSMCLIMHQKARQRMTMSLQMNPPGKADASSGFPNQIEPSKFGIARFMESRTFVGVDGEFDPFTSNMMFGGFIVTPGHADNAAPGAGGDGRFRSKQLTRKSYCAMKDDVVEFTASQQFVNACFWEKDGDALTPMGRIFFAKDGKNDDNTARWWHRSPQKKREALEALLNTQALNARAIDVFDKLEDLYTPAQLDVMTAALANEMAASSASSADPTSRFSFNYLGTPRRITSTGRPVTLKAEIAKLPIALVTFQHLVAWNVPTFFEFLTINPNHTWATAACALMSMNCARMFVGSSMYKFNQPGESNQITTDFRVHGKPSIIDPSRVAVSHVCDLLNYEDGDNGQVFHWHSLDDCAEYGNPEHPSYLVIPSHPPKDDGPSLKSLEYFDITGKFHESLVRMEQADVAYAMAPAYAKWFGWTTPNSLTACAVQPHEEVQNYARFSNTIVIRGAEFVENADGANVRIRANKGHLGPDVGPGWNARRTGSQNTINREINVAVRQY